MAWPLSGWNTETGDWWLLPAYSLPENAGVFPVFNTGEWTHVGPAWWTRNEEGKLAALGLFPLYGRGETFRHVILPLAFPGVVAGSIFTFSLTLGDFIVPSALGNSSFFIGQAVLSHQGTSGNIPLAAAFTEVPMLIMGAYLLIARRLGAFDAL